MTSEYRRGIFNDGIKGVIVVKNGDCTRKPLGIGKVPEREAVVVKDGVKDDSVGVELDKIFDSLNLQR